MPSIDFLNILSSLVKTLDKNASVRAPRSASTLCSAWRDVTMVPTEGPSLTIAYRYDGSVHDPKCLSDFAEMLKRSDPLTIEVYIFLTSPEQPRPDVRVIATAQIVELVMPHFSRVKRFDVITTFDPTYNARTLWIRRPSPSPETSTDLLPFHLLQDIHLQNISILHTSYLQAILENSPNLRSAAIYCGGGHIETDHSPSPLSLDHLDTLFADAKIFDVLIDIGCKMPNIRSLAVPADSDSVQWAKVPGSEFPKLTELLVGGLAANQLLAILHNTRTLKSLWLQHCAASSALVEVLCTKRGQPSCYPIPKLEVLRIENGSLNDTDVLKLVSRRASPPTRPAARTTAIIPYPVITSTFLVPCAERGIRELHLVECPNTSKNAADAIKRGMLGSWHNRRKIGRGGPSPGNGAV